MDEYREVDVTGWRRAAPEQLGTKPKYWLADPDGDLWLFKETTSNRRADGSSYWKGDDWAERIAGSVAGELGLPTAAVELAVVRAGDRTIRGVISKKVLDNDHELIHGNELLAEIGVLGSSTRDRTGYTLSAVQRVLTRVEPPVDGIFDSWDWYAGYLVLDALVGNTDRHQENWAVVGDGERRLAPSFDHASCLGFLLDDEQRAERLATKDGNRTVTAYAAKAESKLQGSPHPCDVAIDALATSSRLACRHWIGAVERLESIEEVLARIPPHRASRTARQFAAELHRANRSRLLSQALSTLAP